MPVGGAHRGIFKSSGGLGTTDSFDRANGALGSTDGGNVLAWQAVKGTWSITANRPTTTSSRDTNPVAVVDGASNNVDVKVDVSSAGGDALYFRVVDSSNWLRLRVDNTTYSSTYSYQCSYTYSTTDSYQYSYTCYATSYCQQYSWRCVRNPTSAGPSDCGGEPGGANCYFYHGHSNEYCTNFSSSSSCCGGSISHSHYGNTTCYCVDGDTHTHSTSPTNEGTAGYGACGSYSYTCYATGYTTNYATGYQTCYATAYTNEPSAILDKNVAGTVTQIATYPDDPTSLRVVTNGTSVTPMINGVAKAAQTVTEHQAATKHGFGRGPSANDGTAIDNFVLTTD